MTTHEDMPTSPRRGIYLLPNLFTTSALFAGFYAIIAGIQGNFVAAAVAVFVAGLFDATDGRVARLTNTQSDFGVQYDSLSDLVSFGLAPALVMYSWSLASLHELGPAWGKLGWAAAFLYAACAALRLARFNTQQEVADKSWFEGLASPAAAGLVMAFIWAMVDLGFDGAQLRVFSPVLMILAGLLMVSRVRYHSFKARPKDRRIPFVVGPLMVIVLVLLAVKPAFMLLAGAGAYVLSGPLLLLRRMQVRRRQHEEHGDAS